MSFTVAIIGRPNVGKSTLFNRLVGKKLAIVDDTPGVTRDRRDADARLGEFRFKIIDTAGLEEGKGDSLSKRMRDQTDIAIKEADFALFMYDARAGVMPLDRHFADILRKAGTNIILIANKCEGVTLQAGLFEASKLGLGEAIPISSEHGEGLGDLIDGFDEMLLKLKIDPDLGAEDEIENKSISIEGEISDEEAEASLIDDRLPMQIAIVGRPNAGKSTLINRLLGEERLLTGPEAGLTRDSIGVTFFYNDGGEQDREIRMFDTAGLRRKSKVQEKLEKLSTMDTIRALNYAEVVVLIIDATIPFERQDLSIASLVVKEGRALVIALNKYDLVEDRQEVMKDIHESLEHTLPQIKGIPVVPISALTGRNFDKLMPEIFKTYTLWNRRISTSKVNQWLAETTSYHPPPSVKGRRLKMRYMTQIKTRPPTFAIFVNRPDDLARSYQRYLLNELRWDFELPGIPIRIYLRGGDNPYDKPSKTKRKNKKPVKRK